MSAQNRLHYSPQTSVASKSRIAQIVFLIFATMPGVMLPAVFTLAKS
jgi:hypothetical protein